MLKPIQTTPSSKPQKKHSDLNLRYKIDPESKKLEISLSDGTTLDDLNKLSQEDKNLLIEKFRAACKNITGQDNCSLTTRMLSTLSEGICGKNTPDKTNNLIANLHALSPDNPLEACLIGQFLALQSQGMRALSLAENADMFYHIRECFNIGVKLLRVANETLDTLTRYKTKGQQQVFVTHVNEGGKAVVCNLSQGGGDGNKS